MLVARTENIGFRRNKRRGMTKNVTERYIRRDIPCGITECTRCPRNFYQQTSGHPMLTSSLPVVIPDSSVVSRYIELLESEDSLKNLVFCQTVLEALDRRNRTRTIGNVRRIAMDVRRGSVVFANEVFEKTRIDRMHGESLAVRDMRAVRGAAAWLSQHDNSAVVIVATLRKADYRAFGAADGFRVLDLGEFLATYHPSLVAHCAAITEATADKPDMDISALDPAEYAQLRLSSKSKQGYASYWSPEEVADGLRTGTLVRGKLRMTRSKDRESVGVVEREGKPDIVVTGRLALNRAADGDIVVVRVLASSEEISELADNNNDDGDGDDQDGDGEDEAMAVELIDAGEETALGAGAEMAVAGVVVSVPERKWRMYVATLQTDEAGGAQHLAVPVDVHVPKIRIHYMDAAAISGQYFVVAIDTWPADSQYPHGHFVRPLGPVGDLDTEIDVILVERRIAVSQAALGFSKASLREMPLDSSTAPWQPDAAEVGRRRDLRDQLIFSIDPKGSQDIDDAISMRRTDTGYEMGVHIADVSQFVKPGMATDTEAQARGTTVYLADRRFNMIPEVLSERICSLRGGTDRYAMSVVWQMDADYNVVDTWFGRTVIRSACEMYYEQAQALLDGASTAPGLQDKSLTEQLRASIVELTTAMRVL
ncbi:hypothetical protein FBU59_001236, partial [Linderina macrospora]